MKLKSFKALKSAVIIICMLAAGICYSCSRGNDNPGPADTAIALTGSERTGQSQESAGDPQEAGDTSGPENAGNAGGPESAGNAGGTESAGNAGGTENAGNAGGTENTGMTGSPGAEADLGQAEVPLVYVHVCGLVCSPGVYGLPEGSRVYEAIETAGGFAEDAAADYLNLAEVLEDGMKLQVPDRNQADDWESQGLTAAGGQVPARDGGQKPKVNLNTASREELMTLRGIGESRAEDIIRYRDSFGGFKTVEDIMNVSGIKDAAFEKIKDSITV